MGKVKPYPVRIDFFNLNGKWKYEATCKIDCYSFDEDFRQQIVDNQDGLTDGWQENEGYYVVIQNDEQHPDYSNEDPFVHCLKFPDSFSGYVKRK